jgi:hypothetical protein
MASSSHSQTQRAPGHHREARFADPDRRILCSVPLNPNLIKRISIFYLLGECLELFCMESRSTVLT